MIRLRDLVARLRLQLDKSSAQQAEQETRGSFDRIGQAAKRLGLVIAAAFSVRAITRFARGAVAAFEQIQRDTNLVRQAVENMGVAWSDADATIKALTDSLWETHRLTGGEILPIFRTLINVTGDYQTAVHGVGVAADMAAALNMDAATAARYLGRVLNGETTALTRYGIQLDENRDILEQLEERFGGTAKAGTTGADAMRKAWGDFREEMGKVLSTIFNVEDGAEGLAQMIRRANRWLAEHEARWIAIGEGMRGVWRYGIQPLIRGIGMLGRAVLGVAQIFVGVFFGVLSAAAHGLSLLASAAAVAERAKARFLGLFSKERAEAAERQARAIEANAKALREWAKAAQEVGRELALRGLGFAPESTVNMEPGGPTERLASSLARGGAGGTPGEAMEMPTPTVGMVGVTGPLAPTVEEVAAARDRIGEYANNWMQVNEDIIWSAETAAMAMTAAWEDAFDTLLKEGEGFGEFMGALGRGMGAALLAGLGDYASQKQRAAIAEAIHQTALGFGAMAWGNAASAGAHFKSAATATAAAAAWAALAGGAASGGSALRGGGRGGGGIGGARDVGGSTAARAQAPGPEVNIHLVGPGWSALNPAVQKVVYGAMQEAGEVYGPGAKINVHRGG